MHSTSARHPLCSRSSRGGPLRVPALRLPPGYSARWLGDPDAHDPVRRWLLNSPDHTVYHLAPYLALLRTEGSAADVLLVSRDGNPLFALPIHSWNATGIATGYSGVAFPATRREASLRRSVAGLAALIAANRDIPLQVLQSAQASAYEDRARTTFLQQMLESEGFALDPVYARLLDLDGLPEPERMPVANSRHRDALAIDGDWLCGEVLRTYDADARNQIRQAVRRGLTVEYVRGCDREAATSAYARFQPVHEESWRRTGLLPKTLDHWLRLSESIVAGGGEDLVVLVLGGDGEPLAGVVCHAYRSRAIYWSGCSSATGLALRANPLCLHGAILACRRQGVLTFELGRFRANERSSKERSVGSYKAQFGGNLVRVASFSSRPCLRARTRAAAAGVFFEARRRLGIALDGARARRDGARAGQAV